MKNIAKRLFAALCVLVGIGLWLGYPVGNHSNTQASPRPGTTKVTAQNSSQTLGMGCVIQNGGTTVQFTIVNTSSQPVLLSNLTFELLDSSGDVASSGLTASLYGDGNQVEALKISPHITEWFTNSAEAEDAASCQVTSWVSS